MQRIDRNNYYEKPKSSTIYTPISVVNTLYDMIEDSCVEYKTVLDPAVGTGNLINRLDCKVTGVDTEDTGLELEQFILGKFEDTVLKDYKDSPDLVICNPPFNGHPHRKLYPEVFLRHIVDMFGTIPIVMICPITMRLNQRKRSKRWIWMKNNIEISSILTLPLDIFDGVLFHSEVLFFNFPRKNLKAHYFLEGLEEKEIDIFGEDNE